MKRVIEVPWKTSEALAVFAASWVLVPLAVWALLATAATFWPAAHHWLNLLGTSDITVNFIMVALDALVGLLLVKLILDRYHVGWSAVGLRRVKIGRAIAYVTAALIAFLILVALSFAIVSLFFPHFNADQAQVNEFTQPKGTGALRLSFLALVVIPPFIEEIIFRGFIFPALTKRWGIILGAIITSLLFAIAHWQLNVGVYTLILSLILCMMYYKLRSIWPGIFLHMINNYIAFTALIHK
ncbi:MAG TPA: CPBP family intramembrane glutamic endopeptidase [Candidatus Saccharimonadales bacterium]|nr:CPBP family intramembrane glutamic endopeptidase [Candidatus Saccharimonadales bacterium]